MIEPWEGYPQCPCGIEGCNGLKLAKVSGHVVSCTDRCASCRGRRNRSRGRRNQTKGHRALGGTQLHSPADEEATGAYTIAVQVEHKDGGNSVPTSFGKFVGTEWFRRALSQANRARRVGEGSMPAVMIDGRWLIVDCAKDKDGAA